MVTGTNYLLMKSVVMTINPFSLLFWRFFLASACLLPFVLTTSHLYTKRNLSKSIMAGVLLALAMSFLAFAVESGRSAEAAFWVSSDAILIPILLFFFYKTPQPKTTVYGIFLAIVGIALLSINESLRLRSGSILGLSSAFFFAVWIIYIEKVSMNVPPLVIGAIQCVTVSIFSFLFSFFFGGLRSPTNIFDWGSCIFLGVIGTGFRFSFQAYLQRFVSSADVAIIYLFEPVVAAILGYYFLSEIMTYKQMIGCIFILSGIALSQHHVVRSSKNKTQST